MSANIPIGKLSFTVFGSGYNSDRADSGSGMKQSIPLAFAASYAEFDPTGEYCWIKKDNNGAGLYKYRTRDWTIVDQGLVPTNLGYLYRPSNTEDGYGIAYPNTISSEDAYLFDLTTNEIISSASVSTIIQGLLDCIDVGSGIYRFCIKSNNRGIISIYSVDTSDFTVTKSSDIGNRAGVGFIDDDSMYAYYKPEWFYQQAYVGSYNTAGGQDWGQQAPEGDNQFSNVSMHGFTDANGHIYVPTLVNGVWKIGEYDGTSQVNFITPNYIRAFGNLGETKPTILPYVAYSCDRSLVAFMVQDVGLYLSDFDDVYLISDFESAEYRPLAVSENMIICVKGPKPSGSPSLEVFEF